ncbi:MAG TPA: response regulator [Burkholderiales bacterium]|jgi:DNA-binding response OmpR family regulator|nr:response regulator [Burkholderiales bacterium]
MRRCRVVFAARGSTLSYMERRNLQRALRVLVADDDRDTVEALAVLLQAEGHVVHSVYTGKDVLPAARLFRPDAIVLDVAMPEMSGYAVAQAIRQSFTDLRRPLLVAISGVWKQYADRQVGQQVGFDHYLEKPANPAVLLAILDSLHRPGAGASATR